MYVIAFRFGIIDNKCDYFLKVLYVIDILTLKNYPSEASIMVVRQLKIVSQIDVFTVSATRNIQYVFKKLACSIGFVKDIFDIYLNNIYHFLFSLHFVC